MKEEYKRRHSRWYELFLLGMPFQLLVGLPIVNMLPALNRWGWGFWGDLPDYRANTLLAITLAFLIIMFTLRRLNNLPGSQMVSYTIPTVTFVFLTAVAVLFFTREEYTRQVMFTGYLMCMFWFITGNFIGRRYRSLKLAIVPFGKATGLQGTRHIELRRLRNPDLEGVRYDGVVADLHSTTLTPEWERFLAKCTLAHIPVYHIKHVQESITGRVEITHLSENEFGSLLPSAFYQGFKRVADFIAALVLLPLLAPIMAVVAMLIKLDSSGPVFFVQKRMGYRGIPFKVYKFRSMHNGCKGSGFTECENDPRITRVGRVIRKYRLDELPQVFNVLKGEMSFIGPRPESMALTTWYEKDVSFFSYRHVVRPGISGWAQVEQGYAAEVEGMTSKLQYDFYYIKHFSLWIDILIAFKTLRTIFTGFGAR